jgi:hypothetical protein
MWKAIEQYHDVITNGLDLLSFILVTPELLRFAQPVFKKFTYGLGGVLIFFVLGLINILFDPIGHLIIAARMGSIRGSIVWLVGAVLLVVLFFYFLKYVLGWWDRKGPETGIWLSSHAFVIGVSLFFVSRLFGFAAALQQLLVQPE